MTVAGIAGCFGENLGRARNRADISQEELSFRASIHRTEVSSLERGLRVPRIDTLVKLASSLSVSPSDLLAGMEWTPAVVSRGSFVIGAGRSRQRS
jgi:transcriptional regulator with XRE-family HTH domain